MPRIVNAPAFELNELVGNRLIGLIGCINDDDPFGIEMLFIRVNGDPLWHRLFLQAGIGFWEKWHEDEAFGDYLDYRRIDFEAQWKLTGKRILSAECFGSDWAESGVSEFRIRIDGGLLTYRFTDPEDGDSESALDFTMGITRYTEQADAANS